MTSAHHHTPIPPDPNDFKATLLRYLQIARQVLVWKLEGLSEYDIRRPLTPTGTNLLGVVKHVASVEAGYLGDCFGHPFPETFAWFADDAEPDADFLVDPQISRDDLIELYHRVWEHSDATVAELDLDATGDVPWWGDRRSVTLHQVLVHITTETHRHAGQLDIVRELIDGTAGFRADASNLPPDDGHRGRFLAKVQAAADTFRSAG